MSRCRRSFRSALFLSLLFSAPAWATGEGAAIGLAVLVVVALLPFAPFGIVLGIATGIVLQTKLGWRMRSEKLWAALIILWTIGFGLLFALIPGGRDALVRGELWLLHLFPAADR